MRVVLILVTLVLLGCNGVLRTPAGQFADNFFRFTTAQQLERFHKYGLETQYELLIFGNQIMHPPAVYLVDAFAQNGEAAIPFISKKLERSEAEVTVRDLVAILAAMDRLRIYDVSGDPTLMALVEERTAVLHGEWAGTIKRMVGVIRDAK